MLIITTFFCLTTIILYKFLAYFRFNINAMEGMVLTMSISMALGLIIGIIVGISSQGSLLLSFLVSGAIAAFIGLLVGLLFSYQASFEGVFSGLMAAMMSVMIVAMIPMNHHYIFLFVSSMFFIVTAVCCFIFILSKQNFQTKISFVYLIGIIWVLVAFVVLVSNTPTSFQQININHQEHSLYKGD